MNNRRLFYWVILIAGLLIFFFVLRILQLASENANQSVPPSPTIEPLPTQDHVSTPVSNAGHITPIAPNEDSCQRPYQESSIWNIPIDWSLAKVHPMSDLMMAAFFEEEDWIGSDASRYTPNIYWVSNDTAQVPVKLREYRFRDALDDRTVKYGEPAGTVWMPLPPGARPAIGTDGQLVVINTDTGEEWGLNVGYIDATGKWFADGAYRYSVENTGIPPEGFAQRGAGIGQLAGIVRRCEIDRGRIDHAVTIAYDYPCAPEICKQNGWPASIPPFRKTDGRGTSQYDIPEGARIAIRPEITKEQIEKACDGVKGCVLWIQNMQEYGGFIVDNSGHPKTYAEGNPTAKWEPDVWNKDMLNHIPTDWYVVIDWNFPSTKVS